MKEPAPRSQVRKLRADAKYDGVADRLRREIVRGVWLPGQKLPTWDILGKRYAIGRPTLTRAMELLKREGFIEADSTRGTHVTEFPPHLNRYVLLFSSAPGRQGSAGWNLFWNALAMQATAFKKSGGPVIDVLFDVNVHVDCEAYTRMMEDARCHRLAGVFVALGGDLSLIAPPEDIPCVHIGGGKSPAGSPYAVHLDWHAFYAQATAALVKRGCRKIAVLSNDMDSAEACAREIVESGAECRPQWTLVMPGTSPGGARNLMRLLVSETQRERPDGLIITDDNLVSSALAGALDEGISVPDDLRVVAHCNWPGTPPPISATRLGFSAAEVLDAALSMASALRASRMTNTQVAVRPVLEQDSRPQLKPLLGLQPNQASSTQT
jgi:hypothetical protein